MVEPKAAPKKIRIGDLLVSHGLINETQLKQAQEGLQERLEAFCEETFVARNSFDETRLLSGFTVPSGVAFRSLFVFIITGNKRMAQSLHSTSELRSCPSSKVSAGPRQRS